MYQDPLWWLGSNGLGHWPVGCMDDGYQKLDLDSWIFHGPQHKHQSSFNFMGVIAISLTLSVVSYFVPVSKEGYKNSTLFDCCGPSKGRRGGGCISCRHDYYYRSHHNCRFWNKTK
jgi:hypothetical protein